MIQKSLIFNYTIRILIENYILIEYQPCWMKMAIIRHKKVYDIDSSQQEKSDVINGPQFDYF